MSRLLVLICILSLAVLPAQPQSTGPAPQVPPAQATPQPTAPVAADAPVLTIHGLCPGGKPKSDSCTTVMTRQQFEAMVNAVNLSNQNFTPAALRNLATSFITILALSEAAQKEGVDKDPRFEELMKVTRTRLLAEAYRRHLQEKYAKPAEDEIQAYYKENLAKFVLVKIDRILVPKVNPKRSQEKPGEFDKKARQLANEIRERAARGEDINALQAEVYTTLGIQAMPPQTELNEIQRNGLMPAAKKDLATLKPGEVTPVEAEPSGFNIYKIRSRVTTPLEQARPQVIQELSQKNLDADLKAATNGVHSEFNEDFFNPKGAAPPSRRIPARMVTPGTAPGANVSPASSGAAAQPSTPK